MMDRRTFIGATAALMGTPALIAAAQPGTLRRIGFLSNANPTSGAMQLEAFRRGLREQGWIEGQNVTIDYGWAEGDPVRLPGLVAELVRSKVEVIVVSGPLAIAASQKATRTIPIVFVLLVDPVPMGFVRSLGRPGGNMTGLASHFEELITKQLQLLKEAIPGLARIAFLRHAQATPSILSAAQSAARSLGLITRTFTVARETELESAFVAARRERAGAVHVLPSPYLGAQRARVIELAARYRLPACYELRIFVQDGGLMSYGPSVNDLYGRAASYVDRILKGAKPGDLPIERPARFELVINMRTARALELSIPKSVLAQADEVIE